MINVRVVKYRIMQGGVSYRLRVVEYDSEDTNEVIFIHPEEVIPHSILGRVELGEKAVEIFQSACTKPAIDYDKWCEVHDVNLPVVIDLDTDAYNYSFLTDMLVDVEDEDEVDSVFNNIPLGNSDIEEIEESFDELFAYLDERYEILDEHKWFALISENLCMAVSVIKDVDQHKTMTDSAKTDQIHKILKQVKGYTGRVLGHGKS